MNSDQNTWEFNCFRLEKGGSLSLWRGGEMVHVQPKSLEVLHALVSNSSRIITREELMQEVWPDTFVEEGNINFAISNLRRVLKENSDGKTDFIETVPKVGYRFLPEVTRVVEDVDAAIEPAWPGRSRPAKVKYGLFAIVFVFLFSSFGIWWQFDRGLGLSTVPVEKREFNSIAVLPPKDLSGDGKDAVLSAAVADSLVVRIGELGRVAVRPITSTLEFADSGKDEISFARDLKVDAVLSSTIVRDGESIRLNFRLLDTRDGAVVWRDFIDIPSGGLVRTQDLVSSMVARDLATVLGPGPGPDPVSNPTENEDAYAAYLKGKYLQKLRVDGVDSSLVHFERAVKLDPGFAEAYVGIADALAFSEPPQPKLEQALSKAIELDPDMAEAWATRGFVRMFHHWDWLEAEKAFKRAIELEPYNAKARHWHGVLLTLKGDIKGARDEMTVALNLDPSSAFIRNDLAYLHYFSGDLEKAEKAAETELSLDSRNPGAHMLLYRIAVLQEDTNGARDHLLSGAFGRSDVSEEAYASSVKDGFRGLLSRRIESLKCGRRDVTPTLVCAELFLLLGQRERALRYLEMSAQRRLFLLPYIKVDPIWDDLRTEPRFKSVVASMSLTVS